MRLGILGVGHLASYTVAGLRQGGDRRPIVLGPRNATVAAELAQAHGCTVAASNQAVVAQSDALLLAVRPQQCESLLKGLVFKPGQLVISVMAGVSLSQLSAMADFSTVKLVRSLPIQCAAVGVGPVPIFPANEDAQSLLGQLGTVVVLAAEEQFEVASAIGCMHGWVYPWLQAMADWGQEQGLDSAVAHQLTSAAVLGATAYARAQGGDKVRAIGEGIATEGTYTRAGLDVLEKNGALQAWTDAMQTVMAPVNK